MKLPARLLSLSFLFAGGIAHASQMPPPLADLAAKVMPAIVSIAAMSPAGSQTQDNGDDNGGGDGNGDNGGDDSSAYHQTADTPDDVSGTVVPPPKSIESLGAGFVFDPSGYILTNNHVVDDADSVTVTFQDGSVYQANIAGRDKDGDLAVLKIDAGHPLPYLHFGDSAKLRVGDWVLAVGNPFGLPGSASAGIVSALHRQIGDTSYDDFIQTDAAINRGNSGGPLFDMAGDVIGVDSAIYAPGGNSDGVGFAIPSAMAEPVAQALAKYGVMNRGWLGAATQEVTPEIQQALHLPDTNGALVGAVSAGGPSDGKLQPGDVITALAGAAVSDPRSLLIRTAEIPAGQSVPVDYWRDGAKDQASLTVSAPPPPLDETIQPPASASAPVNLPAFGLSLSVKPADGGVTVLAATGPAAKAGIVAGDLIEQVDGLTVTSAQEVRARIKALGNQPPVLLISGDLADGTDPGPRWVPIAAARQNG